MKRWLKLVIIVLLAIASLSLFNHTTQALSTPPNCIRLGSQLRCADSYCAQGTFVCDSAGLRCNCQPILLASTEKNNLCKVAAGSEMFFEKINPLDKTASKIYLRGGIWQDFITKSLEKNASDISKEENALVFNRVEEYGLNKARYLSNAINAYNDIDTGKVFAIGLEVEFQTNSSQAYVLSQYMQTVDKNNGFVEKCGTGTYKKDNSDRFFYRKSAIGNLNNPLEANMVCYTGPSLLDKVFRSVIEESYNPDNALGKSKFINCNSDELKAGTIGSTRLPTYGIDYKYNQDFKYFFSNIITIDKDLMGGSKSYSRVIRDKNPKIQDTVFFGRTFPAVNDTSSIPNVNEKTDKEIAELIKNAEKKRADDIAYVKNTCETKCTIDKNTTNGKNFSEADINLVLNNECKHCPKKDVKDKNNIVYLLETNPKKSIDTIIAEQLGESVLTAPRCTVVNSSFGGSLNESKNPKYKSGSIDNPPSDEKENSQNQPKKASEEELNNFLPNKLIHICENKYGDDEPKRMQCKYNALTCYESDFSQKLLAKDVCSNLPNELSTTKWALCPAIVTGSSAVDDSAMTRSVFNLDPNLINNKAVEKAWKFGVNIANTVIIIVFILIIISQITGYGLSNYSIKKMLPRIVVCIILANLSLYLMKIIVDVSNIVGHELFRLFDQTGMEGIGTKLLTMAVGAGTTVGVGLLLGFIGLTFPIIIIIISGFLFLLFIISFRQLVIITSAIIMPIAIVLLLLPNGDKLFNKVFKLYLGVALLYPSLALLYGTATWFSNQFSSNDKEGQTALNIALQVISWIMPYAAILFTPKFVISIINGFGSIGKMTADTLNRFQNSASSTINNSSFAKNIKEYDKKRFSKLKGMLFNGLYDRNNKDKNFFNKTFNKLTNNAGDAISLKYSNADLTDQRKIVEVVGNNKNVLNALQTNDIKDYENLSEAEKYQFKLAKSFSAANRQNLPLANIQLLAQNGSTNFDDYDKEVKKARELGASDDQINQVMQVAFGKAKMMQNTEVQAILQLAMEQSKHKTFWTIEPSEKILSDTDMFVTNPKLLEALFDNQKLNQLNQSEKTMLKEKKRHNYNELLSSAAIASVRLKLSPDTTKNILNAMTDDDSLIPTAEYVYKESLNLNDEVLHYNIAKNRKDAFYQKLNQNTLHYNLNWRKEAKKMFDKQDIFDKNLDLVEKAGITKINSKCFNNPDSVTNKAVAHLIKTNNKQFIENIALNWNYLENAKRISVAQPLIDLNNSITIKQVYTATDALTNMGYFIEEVQY